MFSLPDILPTITINIYLRRSGAIPVVVKCFGCAVGVVDRSDVGVFEGARVYVGAGGGGVLGAGAVVGCSAALAVVDDGCVDEGSDEGEPVRWVSCVMLF